MEAAPDIATLLEHSDWVRALARSLVADPARVDDVVQETWLEALRSPPRDPRNPRGWLGAVARNAARKLGRGEARRARREEGAARAEAEPSAAELVLEASLQRDLASLVLELEEPYRQTLLLRYFRGLAAREIAESTSVPLATVRTRLARGLEQLRAKLDRRFGGREAWGVALAPLADAVHGSVLTTSGAWIMGLNAKWVAATVVALAAATWWWTSEGERAPLEPAAPIADEVAFAVFDEPQEPAATRAPATETVRELASPASPPERAVSGIPKLSRDSGRCVDLAGRPIAGLELERVDLREPRWDGAKMWVGNSGLEVTAELRALLRQDALALEQTIASLPAGVHVREALLGEPWERPRTTTRADGSFTLEVASEGGNAALVRRDLAVAGTGLIAGETQTVMVVAPAIELAGEVVDSDGKPIEGSLVDVFIALDSLPGFPHVFEAYSHNVWSDETDDRGRFALERVASVPGARISAVKRGFEGESIPLEDHSRDDLNLVLERAAPSAYPRLRGRVVDFAGSGIAGADVRLGQDDAQSDEKGEFELGLSILPRSGTPLTAQKAGMRPAVLVLSENELKPGTADREDLRLELLEPLPPIRGRVLHADGSPAIGWEVELHGATRYSSAAATVEGIASGRYQIGLEVDAGGRFELGGLLDREYRVRAWDPESLVMLESESVRAGGEVELRDSEEATIPLIAGRVVSSRGAPVAGAVVGVGLVILDAPGSVDALWSKKTETDADGRFVIERVPRRGSRIGADGAGIVFAPFDLPQDAEQRELVIEVELEARVQLELREDDPADRARLLDAEGRTLSVILQYLDLSTQQDAVPREAGTFPPFDVSELAETMVLLSGGEELRRVRLALQPREVDWVRP